MTLEVTDQVWRMKCEDHLNRVFATVHGGWSLYEITGGGSDRVYYRFQHTSGVSSVVMRYHAVREENTLYDGIARFMKGVGDEHGPKVIVKMLPKPKHLDAKEVVAKRKNVCKFRNTPKSWVGLFET